MCLSKSEGLKGLLNIEVNKETKHSNTRQECHRHTVPNGKHFTTKLNTFKPTQNGSNFANDIFKCISLMKTFEFIQNLLKFVRWGLIGNMAVFSQIMAWCQTSDKPLSGAMMACFADAYIRLVAWMSQWQKANILTCWWFKGQQCHYPPIAGSKK